MKPDRFVLFAFAIALGSTEARKPLFATPVPIPAADKKPVGDDYLYDTLRRKLASDQIVKGGALDLDVKEGVVTIKGTVDSEKQKDRAEKVVKKVSGVKSVVNQIKVAHP